MEVRKDLMAGLDILNITDTGLFYINKKIVDSRAYSSNLITVIGNPSIIDGVASNFSPDSYLAYSPLRFSNPESISINFKGTFLEGDNSQCAFELMSSGGTPLSLFMENTRVKLTYGDITVFDFNNVFLKDKTDIRVFLVLRSNSYEFTLSYGDSILQKVEDIPLTLPLSSFATLNIGSSSNDRSAFWLGSVLLPDFFIYSDGALVYTPSVGTSWNFSDILVSDGRIPLKDNSSSVANHIYKFPVSEIKKSGNALLLTCTIDAESYLTIREIGLYIQTPNGRVLFGSINNLSVNKSKGLAYNLVFTVNTTISVLNAVGFPAENGIVVKEPDSVEFKDFTTLQQVNAYVLTNLERIIRMNAGAKGSYINQSIVNAQAGIGHNRPQVIYRLQQELEESEDCYNSLDTFIKLTNRFQKVIERELDFENLEVVGNPLIMSNKDVSGFSDNDYIHKSTPFQSSASWNMDLSFTTNKSTEGTIASLSNHENINPLELGIANNKCYLKVGSLESIHPVYLDSYYVRNAWYDMNNDEPKYFCWERADSAHSFYNFHCGNIPAANSPVVNFPQVNDIMIEHETMSPEFSFSARVSFTDVTTKQYIIGNEIPNSPAGFELFVEDGKIKVNLYDSSTGNLIGTLFTRFNLRLNRFYNINLSYDGEKYTLYYKLEPISTEYTDEETEYLSSTQVISLNSSVNLMVGSQGSSNKFSGKIDFLNLTLQDSDNTWTGASKLHFVYTLNNTPGINDPLYDETRYPVEGATAGTYKGAYLFNQDNLFSIRTNTKYTLSISYSEDLELQTGTYDVTRIISDDITTRDTIYSVSFPIVSDLSNRMNLPSDTYVGVRTSPQISNPFSGIINLTDWQITQGETEWSFAKDVVMRDTQLLQYYRVPDLNRNQYATKDLCNLNRKLKFLNTKFEGNEDVINFGYSEGLTLCMKVDLQDSEPKVLLYKSDLVEDVYFSLKFLNQTLSFTLNTDTNSTTISKALTLPEYDSYTAEPIMITVTYTPHYDNWGYLQMFRNNEPITESTYTNVGITTDPSMFILSNYLVSSGNFGKYLKDLVVIKGVISQEDLRYINNLFDTNH